MPQLDLKTLLGLVGDLTDAADEKSSTVRFRAFLQENLRSHVDVMEYSEAALSSSGDQYNKALQDLVNHVGSLLGFEVEFGRYRGVRNDIGYDGIWQSPSGWVVVVEVKTTDVYTVKTATLLGYINALVSEGRIKDPLHTLGLYVYGRLDSHTGQLENAIMAEGRRDRLRVISINALLNLLELMQVYSLTHQMVLQLLLPAPVQVDGVVNLIHSIVAQEREASDVTPDSGSLGDSVEDTTGTMGEHPSPKPMESDPTGRSIAAVILRGRTYEVDTWRAALLIVARELFAYDRHSFERMAGVLGGRKRLYLARDGSSMRMPAQVPGSSLYIETHFSAQSITRLCYRMLEEMGFPESELVFQSEL